MVDATATNRIGLALSGGGIRAAIFHLGVLRRLAEESQLEQVSGVSTVSGGSLVMALLMTTSGMRWPTSRDYVDTVYPSLKRILTTVDLFGLRAVGWGGLLRFNRHLVLNRAFVLASLLRERWGVVGRLRDLPEHPRWWINTTCLETGKNWRFERREMGDWVFGRHYDPPFDLAEAAAASAAVPYVIGALRLPLPEHGWYRTNPEDRAPQVPITRREPEIHLWDGGAYENLGLEAMFKPKPTLIGCDMLIVSDASAPLALTGKSVPKKSPWAMLKGDLASPRLFDIASDQIRGLRARMFMAELERKTIDGAFLRMGNSVRDIDIKDKASKDDYDDYLSSDAVARALHHPTGLKSVSSNLFDTISRHGYEVADVTLIRRLPQQFRESMIWKPAEEHQRSSPLA